MTPPPPFSYTYTPNIPELLLGLKCSLAISTYQTGKVVIFSAKDENQLIQLPRNFDKPMGMTIKGENFALATRDELIITTNSVGMAKNYPPNPNVYDSLFIPRVTYHTGTLDLHDIHYTSEGLMGVNTLFSCLSLFDENLSFQEYWRPSFITDLKPEDRCHLNGLAVDPITHKPKYVSALGSGNAARSWNDNMMKGGVLIDLDSNEIILDNLPVPHSPRLYDGSLWMLLSATGEVIKVNVNTGKYDIITQINGFVRGMDKIGDYLFVSTSKLRPNSSLFKEAPIADKSIVCGITVIYIPTGQPCGHILYKTSVEEIFDLKVLPGKLRPNILNSAKQMHKTSVISKDEVFWSNPELKENETVSS
ncbi:MAG TPA: TIGR03032 family protein [Fulvivirga sp.]|nr:TIGR03032 family protein [Fulvivirga sp.]